MSFSVLFLCHANVCRSPLAETLLRQGLGQHAAVEISSAGVRAASGMSRCERSARWLADRGYPAFEHSSRRATRDLVERADLALVTDRQVAAAVLSRSPGFRSRTFLMREAPRLAEHALAQHAPPADLSVEQQLRWLVQELDASRGMTSMSFPDTRRFRRGSLGPEIPDAHGSGVLVSHAQVLPMVSESVASLAASLRAVLG